MSNKHPPQSLPGNPSTPLRVTGTSSSKGGSRTKTKKLPHGELFRTGYFCNEKPINSLPLLPATTQCPVYIDHGIHLLFFGLYQFKPRFKRVALGQQHFHIIGPRRLEQVVGD